MAKRRGHGEGAIYQRESDGKWCASVDLGYVKGKRRRKTIYGKTRKEVAEKLKAVHRDQAAGMNIAPEQQTVAQFLERWLDQTVARRNKPRTEDSYRDTVRLHITPAIGHQQLAKLTPDHVQDMLTKAEQQGLSLRSVHYIRTVLRRALNHALHRGYIHRNVATLVDLPAYDKYVPAVFTPEQAQSFLDAVRGHRFELIYRTTLSLGLRRGEVLGLLRSEVDLEAGELRVTGSLQRIRGKLVRSNTPKSKAGKRTLPIPPTLLEALKSYLEEQRRLWPDAELVFLTTTGTPIEPMNLTHHFNAVIAEAKLPKLRFHDLRHSCATFLIAQKEHPKVISAILGHAQISTTMDIYGHVLDETLRGATAKVEDLFTKSK
jgi:integrase